MVCLLFTNTVNTDMRKCVYHCVLFEVSFCLIQIHIFIKMKCAVRNCVNIKSVANKSLSFFNFPSEPALLEKWIKFCQRKKNTLNPKRSRICIKHFSIEDVENEMQFNLGFAKKRVLRRGTVPKYFTLAPQVPENTEESNKSLIEDLIEQSTSRDVPLVEEPLKYIDASTSPCREYFYYDSNLREVEELKSKIGVLERENSVLKKRNRKQNSELVALQRKYELHQKKHAWEIESLEKRISVMETQIENVEGKLRLIFTEGQVRRLRMGEKKTNWSEKDIAQSVTLYAASAKAYRLLYSKKFPLPGVRTLNTWANKLHITKGLIEPVFKLLAASTQMNSIQKLCVLSFDEMKIRQSYCYDISSDSTISPVNYVQVAMLRGM